MKKIMFKIDDLLSSYPAQGILLVIIALSFKSLYLWYASGMIVYFGFWCFRLLFKDPDYSKRSEANSALSYLKGFTYLTFLSVLSIPLFFYLKSEAKKTDS